MRHFEDWLPHEKRFAVWSCAPAAVAEGGALMFLLNSPLSFRLVWQWPLDVAVAAMTLGMALHMTDPDGDLPIWNRLSFLFGNRIFAPFAGAIALAMLWRIFAPAYAFVRIEEMPIPIAHAIPSLDSSLLQRWSSPPWWAGYAFQWLPADFALATLVGITAYKVAAFFRH